MSQAIWKQRGDAVDHTPSSAVTGGDVVVLDGRIGIARHDIAANKPGSLAVKGVFEVVKVTGAFNDGAALYWDADGDPLNGTAGTGALTTTSTNNTFFGFAVGAAAETDETCLANLIGVGTVSNTIHNFLTGTVADPGDAGAIPVTNSGSCSIVTEGAETRTLAVPTYVGQVLSLNLKTDGGDCTITVASAINQTGNNTITMGDAGDHIALVGVDIGGTKAWRVLASDGVALSTV